MRCPGCGSPVREVLETRHWDDRSITRRRQCECGGRWTTDEKVRRGSFHMATGNTTGNTTGTVAQPPTCSLPVIRSVSPTPPSGSLDLLSLTTDPDLDARSLVVRATGPARRKVGPPVYTPEFEAFWREIGQGGKAAAMKAWLAVGSPPAERLKASWARWNAVAWVGGIGVPHTSTWLNSYDWREEPRARNGSPRGGSTPPPAPRTAAFVARVAAEAARKYGP